MRTAPRQKRNPAPVLTFSHFLQPAEAGGLASGTDAYYAFAYGNIHFVCLDSSDSLQWVGSPMQTWLEDDLAATSAYWIIAYWHHAPIVEVHKIPTTLRIVEAGCETCATMCCQFLRQHIVDSVLAGHSHSYEWSFPLCGYYGLSNTLKAA